MTHQHDIQGITPIRVINTDNAATLANAVRQCAENNEKICDYGLYHQQLGHQPPENFVKIQQNNTGIIKHYVADMTITVNPQTTYRQLRETLSDKNQWFPLEPDAENQTIAESITHNVYGPLRLTFGSISDLILGLNYIDPTGTQISVGGRTVKNVAGYDLTRLLVGSLNTIGLITQATLRTWAIPQQITRVTINSLPATTLDNNLTNLLTNDSKPLYLDALWHDNTQISPTIHLAYQGSPTGCDAQFNALSNWFNNINAPNSTLTREDDNLDADHAARTSRYLWRNKATGLVKLIVPAGATAKATNQLRHDNLPPSTMQALPGQGIIWIGGDWNQSDAQKANLAIQRTINKLGSLRIWYKRPDNTKSIKPFLPEQNDWKLMRKLTNELDKQNTFNPGRLFQIGKTT